MGTLALLRRLVVLLALHLAFATGAAAQEKFALLIGNQGYKETVGPLRNPHNDVSVVAAALDKLGFKITVVKDAGYKTIDTALKTHIQQVRRAGKDTISFFYYSGHGASDPETRINYLIPTDVDSADDANLWTNSFELNDIVSKLREQAPEATHYVVFDACRDELRLTRQGKKALGAEKGFTPVSTVTGVMIAYATAPGQTASDVGQKAGPYAAALAEEMPRPGLEAVTMFRNVQLKVKQAIGQDPWLSFPTLPAIYFAGRGPGEEGERVAQIEAAFWDSAKANGSLALLSTYIDRYPNGANVSLAHTMIREIRRKQAQEAAELARAEREREEARAAAERDMQRAQREAAQKIQDTARLPATPSLAPSAATQELKAIEEAAKIARDEAQQAELRRQAALKAAEEARMKVASLGGEAQPSSSVSTLARDIQRELKRLGCFAGDADPAWTSKANEALARYLKATKQSLPNEGLTPNFLDRLKGAPARTCPSPCGAGEKFAGGACVSNMAPLAPLVAPRVAPCPDGAWVCNSLRSGKQPN